MKNIEKIEIELVLNSIKGISSNPAPLIGSISPGYGLERHVTCENGFEELKIKILSRVSFKEENGKTIVFEPTLQKASRFKVTSP